MATIKSYTDLSQSKVLAKILPIESADMGYLWNSTSFCEYPVSNQTIFKRVENIPCWSLAVLLKYLSEINPQVYTIILFPSEGKWILQFAEYGHGNVCEVSYENPVDACYEMILKLHELNLL